MFDKLMRSVRRAASQLHAADSHEAASRESAKKMPEYPHRATPHNVIRIEFEMMLKGAVYERGGSKIKQYGVTVGGATKVVTSGQLVDQATYDALVRAGAIRPAPKQPTRPPSGAAPRPQRRAG